MYSKTRRYSVFLLVIFLASLGGIYVYFQARDLIEGPTISIISPKNGVQVNSSLIDIEGEAKNISRISLNGRQIFVDEYGIFREKLLLSLGYNIITVAAEDRFGRETKEVVELVYK